MAGADESHTNIDELQLARAGALELARGTVLAGRYEIEATLGRGGAGLVLRAYDRELREAVAIKLLRPELHASRWIERLAREVKLARQLRHPNVCRVFDFEKADGHVFIVMELATRGTLRGELEDAALRARPDGQSTWAQRPLEERLADARAVAAGLAAIHEAGIAHRDVTPQNVLRMADGRLVVSDFGLATEVSQTTTSLHGGTLAYMAPEVVRGERASLTSDVWALGIVIHEIVFGERPTWSKPVGGSMGAPCKGRPLEHGERAALAICRACVADDPERRPGSAGEVAAWLGGARVARPPRRGRWLAFAGVAVAAAALVAVRARSRPSRASVDATGFVELPTAATDWSASARVLARIDDRVQCASLLPDRNTIRYVYGPPNHSEDLDLRTGRRAPSPILPEAYRQGCAALSPDGTRLAFQGYTEDGRAFAFVSDHADGRDAVPVVAIADPSMSSEPKWLPEGRAFTFDIDHQHMGLFSLDTHRTTVLPNATADASHSSTRFVVGPRLFIAAGLGAPYRSDFIALDSPLLTEKTRFSIPGLALDLASRDGNVLFIGAVDLTTTTDLWRVDLARRTRERFAMIPGEGLRYPLFTDAGFVFTNLHITSDVWVRQADGRLAQVTRSHDIRSAAPCGDDVIARREGDVTEIVKLDRNGQRLGTLSSNTQDVDPVCAPDGRTWYLSRLTEPVGLYRCEPAGCTMLVAGPAGSLTISPDGERVAFIQIRKTEPVVAWTPTKGGDVHEVSVSETMCDPGWSSNHTLWVSRRKGGRPSWTEVDADSRSETGRVVPGERECSDGGDDPRSPVRPDVTSILKKTSVIRMVPTALLDRP